MDPSVGVRCACMCPARTSSHIRARSLVYELAREDGTAERATEGEARAGGDEGEESSRVREGDRERERGIEGK